METVQVHDSWGGVLHANNTCHTPVSPSLWLAGVLNDLVQVRRLTQQKNIIIIITSSSKCYSYFGILFLTHSLSHPLPS